MIIIQEARKTAEIEMVQELLLEYCELRKFDMALGDYETEISTLPGKYGRPAGCLLVASNEGKAVGCIAYRSLGNGILDCPDWRETGIPRASLLASPAVWSNDTLISAPIAGYFNGWSAKITADFHSWLVTH